MSAKAKRDREGRCRLCERPKDVRPLTELRLTRHHLVPQRLRSRVDFPIHDERNIVPLCEPCHKAVERAIHHRGDRAWVTMLRHALTADEVWFIVEHMGTAWLDRMYPWRVVETPAELTRLLVRAGS